MEEILVPTHSHWWTRLTPCIWNILFILALKYLLISLHVSYTLKLQNHKVDKLMIEDTGFICDNKP